MSLSNIEQELQNLKDTKIGKDLSRFFKTGKGEYGEGDMFLGIKVPDQRKIAKKYYKDVSLQDVQKMIESLWHEYRFTALLLLVYKYEKASEKEQKRIYNMYINNRKYINNWDLVDVTTPNIVGQYLLHTPDKRDVLYTLAASKNLWERRIAIMATFTFIRNNQYEDSLKIATMLLHDPHDLIHKAVGWMLREIGKRNQEREETFLRQHYQTMPRTMLRYAIEKFDEEKRRFYMGKRQ